MYTSVYLGVKGDKASSEGLSRSTLVPADACMLGTGVLSKGKGASEGKKNLSSQLGDGIVSMGKGA